jgi:ABC-type lipoprotein export system ATPase subunit
MSVLDNVIEGPMIVQRRNRNEVVDQAKHLLDRVGLSSKIDVYPETLSGGQQQRAAIARALANDPGIILADEPNGNLDSVPADTIFQLFEQLACQGKAVIVVSHDRGLSGRVTRLLTITDSVLSGEKIE